MKKFFLVIAMIGFATLIGFAQEAERGRGFYFDFGLGTSFAFAKKGIKYNDALSTVKETASDAGYIDIPLYVDFTAGWAVLQNLYVVGAICGMGDIMFKNSDDVVIPGFRLYGAGVRFYPIKKHLQVGADIGAVTTVFISSQTWNDIKTEWGFGAKVSLAYDFNKNMTGHSFALGGAFLANILKDDAITAFSIFAKYIFK